MNTFNIKEWIDDYKESFHKYLSFLNENDPEIPIDEIAFSLLENAGLFFRYTNNSSLLDTIKNMDQEKKTLLFNNFLTFLNNSSLPSQTEEICKIDALTDGEIEQAENIISLRDEYEAAIESARIVFKDIIIEENISAFANAILHINKVDFAFLDRKDIARIATRILIPFVNEIKAPINQNNYWWLYYIREWDKMENEINSDSAWALADTGISPLNLNEVNEETSEIVNIRDIISGNIGTIKNFFHEETPALAAANDNEIKIPVIMWKKDVKELEQLLKNKQKTEDFTFSFANTIELPQENKGKVFAQYRFNDDLKTESEADVYVINTDTNKIIASAKYNPIKKRISQFDGEWDNFNKDNISNNLLFFLIIR